jgi:Holliday junction resolvasome RuvABC endonuclease subunit
MSDLTILGIAIRARWLGFAEINAQCRLIDWGMIYYQRRNPNELKSAKGRLDTLIERLRPSYIAIVRPDLEANEKIATVRSIARSLRITASAQSAPVAALRRKSIRAVFVGCDASSKDEIAAALARLFPELISTLPPARKIWTKENQRMALFDAVSGAIAYRQIKFGVQDCAKRALSG